MFNVNNAKLHTKEKNKITKYRGYTILFTILVITVLSTLAAGVANISIKQRILSRLASDSQTAMYVADAGMECALYHYYLGTLTSGNIECLEIEDPELGSAITVQLSDILGAAGNMSYRKFSFGPVPAPSANNKPCFEIDIEKDTMNDEVSRIVVRGYNVCDSNNTSRVERALEVTFQ